MRCGAAKGDLPEVSLYSPRNEVEEAKECAEYERLWVKHLLSSRGSSGDQFVLTPYKKGTMP